MLRRFFPNKLKGDHEVKPSLTSRPTLEDEDNDSPYDVIILGAGWAGLGAGRSFWKKKDPSFRFCILEGQADIGGRSKTLYPISKEYPNNSMVEMGSQWIQGASRKNPVFRLARKHDMLLHYDVVGGHFTSATVWVDQEVTSCGEEVTPEQKRRTTKRMEPNFEKKIDARLMQGSQGFFTFLVQYPQKKRWEWDKARRKNPAMPKKPPPASILDVYKVFCEKRKLSAQDRQYLLLLLEMHFTQEYAASLEDVDAMWWDHDKEYPGGDVHFGLWKDKADLGTVQGGYSALIQKFAQPLLSKGLIHCNCKVISIDTSADPVVIEYIKTTSTGATESTTQHQVLARSVLCTIPLGVLKAGDIRFNPPLPDRKDRAIRKLDMGVYNKVVFVWSPDQRSKLPWLHPLDDLKKKSKRTKETGKATCRLWMERVSLPGEPQGPFSCCFTAHTHQNASSPIMLYFFIGGRLAKEIESLSDPETQKQAMDALKEWFDDPNIPDPQQMIVSRWYQNPFSRGSYSFYQVGSSPRDRMELAKPLANSRLHFAGEACHLKYYATTHGALKTGQDEAKAMWKHYVKRKRQRKVKP